VTASTLGTAAFPPVDLDIVFRHAADRVSGQFHPGPGLAAERPELPRRLSVTVNHLVHLEGVQLACAVAVDGVGDMRDQLVQLRFVVAGDQLGSGTAFGFGAHLGTVPDRWRGSPWHNDR